MLSADVLMKKKGNKKFILNYIKDVLLNELQNEPFINYNKIKPYLYNHTLIRKIIDKKRNVSLYLDNLLKYDIKLKNILSYNNIAIDELGFFKYKNPINIEPLKESNNNFIYKEDDLNSQFCPYISLISNCKQKRKISFKQSKTNERVLNYFFNNNIDFKNFPDYIKSLVTTLDVKGSDRFYYIQSDGKYLATLELKETSVDLKMEKEFNRNLTILKSAYPFKYFPFFYINIVLYLMNTAGFVSEAKYISIKLLDIIINKIEKKYFTDISENTSLLISNIFDIFYKDKVQALIYDDYNFISEFYRIFNDSVERNFFSFLIGQYKLYIYLKNKYNREVKIIAIELYENKNRNLINKIIGLSDTTENASCCGNSICYEEMISFDQILI